jgi:hypothetical protein
MTLSQNVVWPPKCNLCLSQSHICADAGVSAQLSDGLHIDVLQGKGNPDLGHVKKDYGIGEALKNDLRYYAFGAGGLDKPGAQEKRDQRIGATAGALGTTSPSAPPQ